MAELIKPHTRFWCKGNREMGGDPGEAVGSREGCVLFLMREITTEENDLEKGAGNRVMQERGTLLERSPSQWTRGRAGGKGWP